MWNRFLSKKDGLVLCGSWKFENGKKNLQATGGTLRHHGRNPSEGFVHSIGPNLGYPEFCTGRTLLKVPPFLLEPKKHTVHRFDRRDDFQMF